MHRRVRERSVGEVGDAAVAGDVELDRVLAAIRAGMDANLAAATTKQIQLDLASAESTVIAWEQAHRAVRSLSAAQVGAALDHAGDLARILKDAEREARARLYRTLGLQLLLDPVGNRTRLGCS